MTEPQCPPPRHQPAPRGAASDQPAPACGWSPILQLLVAAALFAGLVAGIGACGTGDLIFPGDAPATNTPVNTATPDPDEDEDDEF